MPSYNDSYSVEWKGFLWVGVEGYYGFGTISDDGSQVWINDVLVVDNHEKQWYDWEDNISEYDEGFANPGAIYLEEGFHPLAVRFYDRQAADGVQLWWLTPDQEVSIPPYFGGDLHDKIAIQIENEDTNWKVVPPEVLYTEKQVKVLQIINGNGKGDLNNDGIVDLNDVLVLVELWLE